MSSSVPRYNTIDASGKSHPIRILFTDRDARIVDAIQNQISSASRSGSIGNILKDCYTIDYHHGDIVKLALGNDPENGDTTDMIKNAAFVSPANSLGHMGGGVDYPLNHIMFPGVAANVKDANFSLAKTFYAVQDRNLRDDSGMRVPNYEASDVGEAADVGEKENDIKTGDQIEYVMDEEGPWYGPLFNALGMAYMPVGSASISPTQSRDSVPNNRYQFLVSAPTMYSPGCNISGTGNAGAAVFAVLGCVQKYNCLLARVGVSPITTIVLPGMGTGVGGMTPDKYAMEACDALVEYGQYYLGYQLYAGGAEAMAMPGHMVDLVPSRNRYFVCDPNYYLCKQKSGYGMEDFDMTYEITKRPDAEVERLKNSRPIGGLFGLGSMGNMGGLGNMGGSSGGMFEKQFGLQGFGLMSNGNDNDSNFMGLEGSIFKADYRYQSELDARLRDEEVAGEEDDLGAEAILLSRMSAMDSSRIQFDEMIRRRNEETINSGSNTVIDFLRPIDPSTAASTEEYPDTMSTESRFISQIEARDADENSNIAALTNEEGKALSMEEAQAKFAVMMSERNNLITGRKP